MALTVVGTSELVRDKECTFLDSLDDIRVLKPEVTELVADDSPRYRKTRLYLESLLRRTPPSDTALHVGHLAAMRPTTYQLQPAAKALQQVRPRILMADGVGLGKTLEVGVLLSELIRRGRGRRILVVALKSILAQFQEELWARFTVPLVRLDSVGIRRVQTRIPSNMNPFYYFDRVIISIDTLKKDEKYRRYLEQCHWDVVVIDECQNVADRSGAGKGGGSQRNRLAQLLARTCDSLVLTSATPHDGKARSFASLINLLEPTAIANEEDYSSDEVQGYFLRRFKKDVAHEVQGGFHDRVLHTHQVSASRPEDRVFTHLEGMEFRTIDQKKKSKGILFRTLLLKAFLSSPGACAETARERLRRIDKAIEDKKLEEGADAAHDRSILETLAQLCDEVDPAAFSKYGELLKLLREQGYDKKRNKDRIVIFSERIATLRFLQKQLREDLGLKEDQIPIFQGSLGDTDQASLLKSFGSEQSKIRILLASDAASEGVNLHFFCHNLVHFDLPWSLITLEQRNGRIDRFGQNHEPHLHYFLTHPTLGRLQGDLRILDLLIEKENEAHKNIGDAAWLLNLHDSDREEEHIAKGIEEGQQGELVFQPAVDEGDWLQTLIAEEPGQEPEPVIGKELSLFEDDLGYAREAFEQVLGTSSKDLEWQDHLQGFILQPPKDLERRFDYLPPELRKGEEELKLTADRELVMRALEDARQEESRWPEWQLFWPLHPVSQWLDDRVMSGFQRHEAPVLELGAGMEPGHSCFLFQGVRSNHRGDPVQVEWFGVQFEGETFDRVRDYQELVQATGLGSTLTNPGHGVAPAVIEDLMELRQKAVDQADRHMSRQRTERMAELGPRLKGNLQRLLRWKERRLALIDEDEARREAAGTLRPQRRKRNERLRHEIESLWKDREDWVNKGMKTNKGSWLRLAAVLIPREA